MPKTQAGQTDIGQRRAEVGNGELVKRPDFLKSISTPLPAGPARGANNMPRGRLAPTRLRSTLISVTNSATRSPASRALPGPVQLDA